MRGKALFRPFRSAIVPFDCAYAIVLTESRKLGADTIGRLRRPDLPDRIDNNRVGLPVRNAERERVGSGAAILGPLPDSWPRSNIPAADHGDPLGQLLKFHECIARDGAFRAGKAERDRACTSRNHDVMAFESAALHYDRVRTTEASHPVKGHATVGPNRVILDVWDACRLGLV
jgi:hypothetical protein